MAKRFIFRLETVRRLRELEVEKRQRALAESIRQANEMNTYVTELNQTLREHMLAARAHQQRTALDVERLRASELHGGWLRKQLLSSHEELSTRQARVDAARKNLIDADRRLKAIEKLKERHAARHRERIQREEQSDTDETGSSLFIRQRLEDAAQPRDEQPQRELVWR